MFFLYMLNKNISGVFVLMIDLFLMFFLCGLFILGLVSCQEIIKTRFDVENMLVVFLCLLISFMVYGNINGVLLAAFAVCTTWWIIQQKEKVHPFLSYSPSILRNSIIKKWGIRD